MKQGRFSIIGAAILAYKFVGAEWRFLLAASVMPLALSIAANIFVQFYMADAGALAGLMASLPAVAATGWYIFIIARLIIFSERPGQPVTDDRRDMMQASVITWVLFKMGLAALFAFLLWAVGPEGEGRGGLVNFIGLVCVGLAFWAVRLALAPIVVSAGYSLKNFIYQVNGALVSLRLLGFAFMACLPVFFVMQVGLDAIMAGNGMPAEIGNDGFPTSITGGQRMALIVLSEIAGIFMTAVLTAGGVYALRDLIRTGPAPRKGPTK